MYKGYHRITIVSSTRPKNKNLNDVLQWFGTSLGLFSLRDKDKSNFRIFIELLKAAKRGKALSSDDVASRLNLSRGTVVHHINKLIHAGMVVSEKNKYTLRVDNLKYLIDEIEKDIQRALKDIRDVAKDIDKRLGL